MLGLEVGSVTLVADDISVLTQHRRPFGASCTTRWLRISHKYHFQNGGTMSRVQLWRGKPWSRIHQYAMGLQPRWRSRRKMGCTRALEGVHHLGSSSPMEMPHDGVMNRPSWPKGGNHKWMTCILGSVSAYMHPNTHEYRLPHAGGLVVYQGKALYLSAAFQNSVMELIAPPQNAAERNHDHLAVTCVSGSLKTTAMHSRLSM